MKPLIILALALLPACAALSIPPPSPCARVTVVIEGVVVEEDKPQTDELIYLDDPQYFPGETTSGVTSAPRPPFSFFPLLGHPDLKR